MKRNIYIYAYTHTHIYMRARTHTHTHTHTYIYIYIYVHTHRLWASQVARVVKNPLANAGDVRDLGSIPG